MSATKASADGLEDDLPLKEFIRAVQAELIESESEREESNIPPLFKVDSLEIEASVVASKRVEGKGGIDIQVVSLGGGGHVEEQSVQKIKLTLSTVEAEDIERYEQRLEEMQQEAQTTGGGGMLVNDAIVNGLLPAPTPEP
ncbi:trypco2 family protein [Halomarina salina]|uniref:Trypco2 family protein n=1 Tax=Halomarina salina TaxID=1872699 RepID=A0ABD5RNR3_9EURY|nr:trypco2 family protein [Halomarina salina]